MGPCFDLFARQSQVAPVSIDRSIRSNDSPNEQFEE